MQDRSTTRATPSSRPTVREELIGPPRPSGRAHVSVIAFGVLMIASLVIDAVTPVSPNPGATLVFAGLMFFMGVAELLDPGRKRLVLGVRFGGMAIALLGLVIQLVPGVG
ncbi:DUF2975 domain-containing protein [Brachybacterium sp. AOP43-C2-M15]|uniref:DUF2975 domain-containing protein n=1 Tax=Brachybacterium sp. AOP43-C2-M15 TaxID=3457661 RepID=UPI0040340130